MTVPYQSSSSPIVIHYGTPRSDRYALIWLCQKFSYGPKKVEHRVRTLVSPLPEGEGMDCDAMVVDFFFMIFSHNHSLS